MEHHRHLGGYFHAISNALSQRMHQNCEALGLTATQSMFLHHLWYREHILQQPSHAKDLEAFISMKPNCQHSAKCHTFKALMPFSGRQLEVP